MPVMFLVAMAIVGPFVGASEYQRHHANDVNVNAVSASAETNVNPAATAPTALAAAPAQEEHLQP